MDQPEATKGLFARLITGADAVALTLTPTGLLVDGRAGRRDIRVEDLTRLATTQPGFPWPTLSVETRSGFEVFRGFPRSAVPQVAQAMNELLRVQAPKRYAHLEGPLDEVVQAMGEMLSGQRYVRSSELARLTGAARQVVAIQGDAIWRAFADPKQRAMVGKVLLFLGNAEESVGHSNSTFVEAELDRCKSFFDEVEAKPLTDAQRRACVITEDNNLVLAGAGTGKTSTMIGRAGYLLASGQAQPEQILMLAFARKAAEEMQIRQESRLRKWLTGASPKIKTFHALGLEIIGAAEGRRPGISVLAEDEHRLAQFIDECMASQSEEPEYREKMIRYCGTERFPYRNPFDFDSMEQYLEYVRENELRTLKSEVVKSFEEVFIANFLNANGVAYEYERPYEVDTVGPDFGQYRPDFFLTDYGIYLEHFALDRDLQPPAYFDRQKYLEGVAWKRELHAKHGTALLETYSYMKREDMLEPSLTEQLVRAGVEFNPRSEEVMLAEMRESSEVVEFAILMAQFLSLFKQSGQDIAGLRRRIARDLDAARFALMLDLFEPVFGTYEAYLAEHEEIDFADMIARATEHVESGRYASPYMQILVDEFQDISPARARLVQALVKQRPEAVLFAVGDDWQSIYRFTGSDISYTRDFAAFFGSTATTSLDLTFRFNDKIGAAASRFVQSNPAQLQKAISSVRQTDRPAISTVRVLRAGDGLRIVLEAIAATPRYGENSRPSVLVLGRFNFSVDEWRSPAERSRLKTQYPALNVEFMTVHAAKGIEADYVIVLGLEKGRYGFPSSKPTDPVMEFLLPPREDFRHAEERRLFYVAITRARHRVYLIYNPLEASSFVTEVCGEDYADCVRTDEFNIELLCAEVPLVQCPRCREGHLVVREGQYGRFAACSNYPYCKHKEKLCPQCGSLMRRTGGSRVCLNVSCAAEVPVCAFCGADMVERTGKFGRFWGCTNYRANSDFVCTNTMPIDGYVASRSR